MASLHSTLTDGGEPGPPHVVRFRWKPELDGELRAGRETFKRIDARRWLRDFEEARESGGWPGVREFVLAWRARDTEPDQEPKEPTLADFMEDWLRRDAVPNLAPNTMGSYLPAYNNHIRALPVDPNDPDGQVFGELPLREFAEPHIHNEFRESLRLTGRSKPNQDAAKKVLSSALSWGVESRAYRRWLPTNGAKLVTGRRRRSNRARPNTRADVRLPRSRVFNAFDYELVRAELVARTDQRTWEPHRDAAMLDLQFGCGCRPEEARGARWWQVLWPTEKSPGVLRVREVVAAGQIDDGKTIGSLRDAILPGVIAERLREWREIAATHGLPTGPQEFIVPGRAPRHGRKHPGGHMTRARRSAGAASTCAPRAGRPRGPTQRATTWRTPPRTPEGAGTSALAWRRARASPRWPRAAGRRARRSPPTTTRTSVTTSSDPTRGSRSSLRARRPRSRVPGPLERRRPKHCAARPVITTGSARSGPGPSRAPAPSIAASERGPA